MFKTAVKHRIHRTLAIIVVPLLLISTLTGFFRANQNWYWAEGYKKKKHPASFSLEGDVVSVNTLVQKIDSLSGKKNVMQDVMLKAEGGNVYYKVQTKVKDKYLAEAYTGNIVSPIDTGLAMRFAAEYVKEKPAVISCELLTDYLPRKEKEKKKVYKVAFDNPIHSAVYLDYVTGDIVEDMDDTRTFGMWMIKLHEYDFFASKRGIMSFVGISIFLVAITGVWIYRLRLKSQG